MYAAVRDPYCYPDTTILKNRPGIKDQAVLDAFEIAMSTQRADEPLPRGRLSVNHYCSIHRHLFGDVYAWAGRYRVTRIAKGENAFCYPEHIPRQMVRLFGVAKEALFYSGLPAWRFITEAAHFLAELNAIHPFREGNGRAQLTFITMVAAHAGHAFDLDKLEPGQFLAAMVASFSGNEKPLRGEMRKLIRS